MTRKAKRLYSIGAILLVIGAAAGLVLSALSDSVAYFNSPTDIVTKAPAPGQRIRLGGLVAEGSVVRGGSDQVTFKVTDSVETVPVTYTGHPAGPVPRGAGRRHRRNARPRPRLRRRHRARQARRELHAEGGRRRPEGARPLGGRQGHGETGGEDRVRRNRNGGRLVIVEIGHYALILALSVSLVQSVLPMVGAQDPRCPADGHGRGHGDRRLPPHRPRILGAGDGLRHLGLLGPQRLREFAIRSSRCSTSSPASGATTRARCSCGC